MKDTSSHFKLPCSKQNITEVNKTSHDCSAGVVFSKFLRIVMTIEQNRSQADLPSGFSQFHEIIIFDVKVTNLSLQNIGGGLGTFAIFGIT